MLDLSLTDMVLVITGVLFTMALVTCLCCLSMKFSDMKMKYYLMEMAKRNGIKMEMDELDPKNKCQSPHANENCTIMIPDVGIIL